ncbi:MAG TPA: tetratricopeptide repeat protein [Candidatus Polarisedimenticolia bacterium]|nr:tetratricopeptide repeat protein [Candidatus Polarisedimenticolia bacterium]
MRSSVPVAPAAIFLVILLTGACGPAREKPVPSRTGASQSAGSQDEKLLLPAEAARWVNQGITEYRQGRYHQASESFTKARDQVPADLKVSTLLGTALLQAKRYAPAREEFRRILTIHSEAVDPRLGLARIDIRQGDFEGAAGLLREVLQREPENLQALYNLGLIRYRAGDYAEASDLLGRLLRQTPNHPEAHVTLGQAYARLGNDAAAESEFRAAIAVKPDARDAHFHLATLLLRAGKKEEAAKEQETFKRLWDRQAADRAAEGRARDLYLAGDFPGALAEYDRLLEVQPGSGRFQLGRAQCFLKLGKKDEAIAALEKAAAADPDLADAHYHLAVLYQERGQEEKSERERRAFEALENLGENKTGF